MNFLAHLHLSGDHPKLMIGNFIGDFVKGRNLQDRFETDIVRGIELHRSIDEFTDSHEVVQASKNRLRPKYRHYSGVIVDMYYDHYLARNWDQYHTETLPDYAQQFYQLTNDYLHIMPPRLQKMLPYMISGNWLVNYGKTEGIHRALSGMARRTPFESKMDEAISDMVRSYDDFEKEFKQFFPELQRFAQNWIVQS